MKILIVNPYYYPNMIGGTEHSVKLLAEQLLIDNNEIAIYSVDSNKTSLELENINGVKVYRGKAGKYKIKTELSKLEKIQNKCIEIYNKTAISEIKKVFDDFKPDIIHTNNLFGISNIIWKIAKEEYKIPIVHTLRDYWMLYPILSHPKLSKILFHKHMKKMTKYVDIVTAPSNYTLNKFLVNDYFYDSKAICVPNAVNIDMKETQNIIIEKRNRNFKDIRFMFVGMLTENKGIRNLLNAFEKIDNDNISLHIYGQGLLKELVEKSQAKDKRIKYYGQLTSEELKKEWIKNDVLIVPSIWEEPFGRVVIEGNQYGLPVIGANRAGVKEIIDNVHTGITYQYDDVNQLVNAIKEFSNRDNIKKYFDIILEKIDEYSVDKQIETFSKLYKELVEKRR